MGQIDEDLGLDPDKTICVSAKEGTGVPDLLEAIVTQLPPPKGDPDAPLKALIFDSHYDPFRGTIVHFRVFHGTLNKGDTIKFMYNNASYKVEETVFSRFKGNRKNPFPPERSDTSSRASKRSATQGAATPSP